VLKLFFSKAIVDYENKTTSKRLKGFSRTTTPAKQDETGTDRFTCAPGAIEGIRQNFPQDAC